MTITNGFDVKMTSDYDMFKFRKDNRQVNRKHVDELIDSYLTCGNLKSLIVVDSDMNIIDGQHRFQACKELGEPIYYRIMGDDEKISISLMNTALAKGRRWNSYDYIHSFLSENPTKDYVELQRIMNSTDISIDDILKVFAKVQNKKYGKIKKELETGEFDSSNSEQVMWFLKEISMFGTSDLHKNSHFVLAFIKVVYDTQGNYHSEIMHEASEIIVANLNEIDTFNSNGYVKLICEAYNRKVRKGGMLIKYMGDDGFFFNVKRGNVK